MKKKFQDQYISEFCDENTFCNKIHVEMKMTNINKGVYFVWARCAFV